MVGADVGAGALLLSRLRPQPKCLGCGCRGGEQRKWYLNYWEMMSDRMSPTLGCTDKKTLSFRHVAQQHVLPGWPTKKIKRRYTHGVTPDRGDVAMKQRSALLSLVTYLEGAE
jgi:hypothetical protein